MRENADPPPEKDSDNNRSNNADGGGKMLVEVLSEGPHCIPCEYMIATVEYVAPDYQDVIQVKIVETKNREDAMHFLELCRAHGKQVPVPSILFEGRLVFEKNPGPDELRSALDTALAKRGKIS